MNKKGLIVKCSVSSFTKNKMSESVCKRDGEGRMEGEGERRKEREGERERRVVIQFYPHTGSN